MKLIISNLCHFRWNFGPSSLNPDFVDEKTMAEIKSLFDILKNNYENVSKDKDEEKYILYFRASKGKYIDDVEYKDSLRYDEEKDAQLIKERWDIDYPNKYKWFSLFFFHSFYRNVNYYSFYFDNNKKFVISDEESVSYEKGYSKIVSITKSIVTKHLKLNSENKFQRMFEKTFGYGKRRGTIQYKDAWKIYPSLKRRYLNQLRNLDLENIFKTAENDEITYFPKFTSGKYYDLCKIGYLALDKKIDKQIDSKILFYKKADGRTQGLENIDIHNEEEFDKWYEDNRQRFDHTFEIMPGRSFYRGDLHIDKNTHGYYLSLSGSDYHTEIDILKFYNALLEAGIKVNLYDKELYKSRIEGTATFAIENEDNWCYGYTTVFGESYIDSIHIEDFPKLIPFVNWEPILMSKYIGKE